MADFKTTGKIKIALFTLVAWVVLGAAASAQQPNYSPTEELFYRINFGSAEDIKILLSQGASPNAVSSTGAYALTMAIGRDDEEAERIVKILLDAGADPNIHDKSNPYPIVTAVANGRTEMVADLLARGANYHVTSPDGLSLVEMARSIRNQDIEKLLQAQLDKEAAVAAGLRTPEHFKELIHQYVFDTCSYQYWNFVYSSRQNPDKDQDTKGRIAVVKRDLSTQIEQIQKYYPTTPTADLQHVSEDISQKIANNLEGMVSNENRAAHGVGTEADANARCQQIAGTVQVDFAPSVTR